MPIAQGPKLRAKGPLPKALLSTKFQVKTHQVAESVGKKVLKIRNIWKSEARVGVGGYCGGRPLLDIATYLRHHRRDIAQTFMIHSPSEILQTCKILRPNSPRGRGVGQKGLKNPENLEKLSPGRGGTGVGDHFGTLPPISVTIHRASPKLLW